MMYGNVTAADMSDNTIHVRVSELLWFDAYSSLHRRFGPTLFHIDHISGI